LKQVIADYPYSKEIPFFCPANPKISNQSEKKTDGETTDPKIGNIQFDKDITHQHFLLSHLSLRRDRSGEQKMILSV
jgi:hypothetical protein